jgi:DNA-binding PadR family transcriptional regulator
MSADLLAYRSAWEILKAVSAHDGAWTWYNITRRVDQVEGVEKDPPVLHILKQLVDAGLLRTEPPEGGNAAVYRLTEQGSQALARLVRSTG